MLHSDYENKLMPQTIIKKRKDKRTDCAQTILDIGKHKKMPLMPQIEMPPMPPKI